VRVARSNTDIFDHMLCSPSGPLNCAAAYLILSVIVSVLLMSNMLNVPPVASHKYGRCSRSDQSSLTLPLVLAPTPLWNVLPIPVAQ
jgi:hypothetical protein